MSYIDKDAWKNNVVHISPIEHENNTCPIFNQKIKDPKTGLQLPLRLPSFLIFYMGPDKEPTYSCPEFSSGVSCSHFLRAFCWEWFANRAGVNPYDTNRGEVGKKLNYPLWCNGQNCRQLFNIGVIRKGATAPEHVVAYRNRTLKSDKDLFTTYLRKYFGKISMLNGKTILGAFDALTEEFFQQKKWKIAGHLTGIGRKNKCPALDKTTDYKTNIYEHGIIKNKEMYMCGYGLHNLPQVRDCGSELATMGFATRCDGRYANNTKMKLNFYRR